MSSPQPAEGLGPGLVHLGPRWSEMEDGRCQVVSPPPRQESRLPLRGHLSSRKGPPPFLIWASWEWPPPCLPLLPSLSRSGSRRILIKPGLLCHCVRAQCSLPGTEVWALLQWWGLQTWVPALRIPTDLSALNGAIWRSWFNTLLWRGEHQALYLA